MGDAASIQAYGDFLTAYDALAGQPCGAYLTGTLAGVTLRPGVYCFDAAAVLTGTLTLDGPSVQEAAAFDRRSLQAVEREHIRQVIRATGGNLLRAASVLEISRTTLYKKIRDYDINVPGPSAPA